MNTEPAKEKKKEIFKLFTTDNKLCSEAEFFEIKDKLQCACRDGDFELIKILLSETIDDTSNSFKFKVDKTNQTASLFKGQINN